MATAGRILIIPKGKWESENTYEALDLVSHYGNTWLCKKTASGIEPTDANDEYWFKFAGNESLTAELAALSETVALKADQEALNALSEAVASKANQTDLEALAEEVEGMSNQVEFDELVETVGKKADKSDLDALSEEVGGKANQGDLNALYEKFGNTDISVIGDGTVTSAISELNGKSLKFTCLQPSAENVKTVRNIGVDYSTLSEKTIITSFLIGVAGYNSNDQITRAVPQPMSGNKVSGVLVECSVAQRVLLTIGVLYTD